MSLAPLAAWVRSIWRHGLKPGSMAAHAFAAACVGAAVMLQALFGFDPDFAVFAPFYTAILAATVVGGWSAGVFATLLGLTALLAFFVPSRFFIHLFSRREADDIVLYLMASATIVAIADHYRRLVRRLREEEHYRGLVVDELQHRLANKAATLCAIVSHELCGDKKTAHRISAQLQAVAATDRIIARSDQQGVAIEEILSAELGPYDVARVSLDGPSARLPSKLAVTLALVFHELATNAAKYGALSVPQGRLAIAWKIHGGAMEIEWAESGGPAVAPPSHDGFGTTLFRRALDPYHGTIERTFAPAGLQCRIALTLPGAQVPPEALAAQAPPAAPAAERAAESAALERTIG